MKWIKRLLTKLVIDRQTLRSMVRDEVELYMARNPEATKDQVHDAILEAITKTGF